METGQQGTPIVLNSKITIVMRKPTDEQQGVVVKEMAMVLRFPERSLKAVGMFFRVFEKMIVNPADIERLDDALIEGEITLAELIGAFNSAIGGQDDAAVTPVKRTRRRS